MGPLLSASLLGAPLLSAVLWLGAWSGPAVPWMGAWDGPRWLNAALALERQGDSAVALAALDALAAREPTWELPRLEAARLRLEREEDLHGAERLLQEAVSLAPRSPRAHSLLGLLALAQGDTPGAIRALERAVEYREEFDEARFRLAGLCADAGDWLKAEHHLRVLTRRQPDQVAPGLGLSRALEMQGRLPDAERELQRLLAQQPTSVAVQRRLADLYVRTGRPREAERLLAGQGGSERRMRPLRPSRR